MNQSVDTVSRACAVQTGSGRGPRDDMTRDGARRAHVPCESRPDAISRSRLHTATWSHTDEHPGTHRAVLARYLETLSAVSPAEFDRWSEARQLAFLINAYNAWTVELILRHYPGIDSIREIGGWFRSPWKLSFFDLLGKRRSLDELEHEMIRENYAEPRIHFAVNCASIGCPALAREPYRGDELERQLEAATQRFLSDRQRNGLSKGALRVSPIFDWYEEDFAKGWRGLHSLPDFLAHYGDALGLSSAQQRQLRSGALRIRHTDYKWALNKRD